MRFPDEFDGTHPAPVLSECNPGVFVAPVDARGPCGSWGAICTTGCAGLIARISCTIRHNTKYRT